MTGIGREIGGTYEWFLRMPTALVVGIMWLVGALLLLGVLAMAAYPAEAALSAAMGLL